jgi:NADPH oxidase
VKVIEATILPDRAVMLKMAIPPRGFTYKAGQYIFINFPMISRFEWHPFTLTSAPHEDYLSCHIRAAGNWTKKVYALCEGFKEKVPDFVKVRVDGPYGSASEHVFTYKHVIMIGAGIGVTPFASVLKRILHRFEQRKPMKLEKVHFFWTCREQGAFQWFADLLSELESHENAKSFLETNTFLTGALAQHDIRSILLWYGLQQEFSVNNVDLVTGLSSRTYWGRPNWERIIECMFAQYPKERLGVFFCGPSPLAHSLHASCKKYASVNGSTFYFHKENF